MQLVDNPAFLPAFNRVVNVPARTVGEKVCASVFEQHLPKLILSSKTTRELLHRAQQLKMAPLDVVEGIVKGLIPDIKPAVKKKLANFSALIRDLRKYAKEVSLFFQLTPTS